MQSGCSGQHGAASGGTERQWLDVLATAGAVQLSASA